MSLVSKEAVEALRARSVLTMALAMSYSEAESLLEAALSVAIPPDYAKRIAELEAYRDELLKIAADVGEPDDAFAAWEAIEADRAQLTALRSLVTEAASAIQAVLIVRDAAAFAAARDLLSRLNEAVKP